MSRQRTMTRLHRWIVTGSASLLAGVVLVRAQEPRVARLEARPLPQAQVARGQAPIDFARDIQPMLEQDCYECHGTKKARGRLRLHTPELIPKGGETGPIVTPRHERRQPADAPRPRPRRRRPDAARRRSAADADDGDAARLDRSGRVDARRRRRRYRGTSRRPTPSTGPTSSRSGPRCRPSRATAWARTPIDRFVLARLEREKLSPSPEASKATLLRRVTLDLTGLPPTPAEVDAFVADTAPDAYERVVDRLLASPHYGERWARPWLDLARYADTNGYEKDNRRDDLAVSRLGDRRAQRATCRSTSSRSSRSPATCCPSATRGAEASPPASIATR